MPRLRVGVIGCGRAAQGIHLPILSRMVGVEIVAVAEPDRDLREAARRHVARGAAVLADYRELAERRDVDAVVVCLPNARHADAAIAAFERGKHVYVEKPLATSLPEAEQVLAAWQRSGAVGMMGFNYRFNRLYLSSRRLLAAAEIGELIAACSVFSLAADELPAWKRTRQTGGGALLDLGSHHLDLVGFLFGEPVTEVYARLSSARTEDDTALVQWRLAGGLSGQSFFSLSAVNEERFEIYGQAGKLTVDRSRYQDAAITRPARRWARAGSLWDAARSIEHAPYVWEKRRTPGHEPSHRVALTRFVAAIVGQGQATPDLNDGYINLRILLAAERSAQAGRAVNALVAP